jgi:hypothetical protein
MSVKKEHLQRLERLERLIGKAGGPANIGIRSATTA